MCWYDWQFPYVLAQANHLERVAATLPLTWGDSDELQAVLAWFVERAQQQRQPTTASCAPGTASKTNSTAPQSGSTAASSTATSSTSFPDVVLASDVAYNREHLPALAALLAQLATGDGSGTQPLVLMSIEDREAIHQQVGSIS